MTRCRRVPTLIVAALALSLPFCGGGSGSTSEAGPTVPVLEPTPTAEPTPMEEAPLSASCAALDPGVPEADAVCADGPPPFLDDMNEVIGEVRNTHPQYFDGRHVLNPGGFYVEIVRAFDRRGLCAESGGQEVGVKQSEAFNDQ